MISKKERAERFKEARLKYNIHGEQKAKEVSEATHISQSMISDLESPAGNPRPVGYPYIVKLAEYYGVNVAWLMGQPNSSPSLDADSQNVTRTTGLSFESVRMLQTMKNDGLIDSMNVLLQSKDFPKFVRWFETARVINLHCTDADKTTAIDDEAYQGMIKDTNGQAVEYISFPGESQIHMCLLRATNIMNQMFAEIMKGDKDNG